MLALSGTCFTHSHADTARHSVLSIVYGSRVSAHLGYRGTACARTQLGLRRGLSAYVSRQGNWFRKVNKSAEKQ